MSRLNVSSSNAGPFFVALKGRNHADNPDGNTVFVNKALLRLSPAPISA
jgi:hypothetical protein